MKKDIEKITVSLSRETLRAADQKWEAMGYGSRSEFIEAAIRLHISGDLLKEFSGDLVRFYERISTSEIKAMEDRLAKLSYKIAVELGQINLLLAALADLSPEQARQLRGDAVAQIRLSNGFLPLPKASQVHRLVLGDEIENGR